MSEQKQTLPKKATKDRGDPRISVRINKKLFSLIEAMRPYFPEGDGAPGTRSAVVRGMLEWGELFLNIPMVTRVDTVGGIQKVVETGLAALEGKGKS